MPRAPGARNRPAAALLVLACVASAAASSTASAAAPIPANVAAADASTAAPAGAMVAAPFASSAAAPIGSTSSLPPPVLRNARIDRTAVLHDDRFVLRASTTPKARPDAQHGNAGLALRAAHLSAKGADPCAEGAIFKDGFEQP